MSENTAQLARRSAFKVVHKLSTRESISSEGHDCTKDGSRMQGKKLQLRTHERWKTKSWMNVSIQELREVIEPFFGTHQRRFSHGAGTVGSGLSMRQLERFHEHGFNLGLLRHAEILSESDNNPPRNRKGQGPSALPTYFNMNGYHWTIVLVSAVKIL